jgi:hypothetical protein
VALFFFSTMTGDPVCADAGNGDRRCRTLRPLYLSQDERSQILSPNSLAERSSRFPEAVEPSIATIEAAKLAGISVTDALDAKLAEAAAELEPGEIGEPLDHVQKLFGERYGYDYPPMAEPLQEHQLVNRPPVKPKTAADFGIKEKR